jgi:hypothetical protein
MADADLTAIEHEMDTFVPPGGDQRGLTNFLDELERQCSKFNAKIDQLRLQHRSPPLPVDAAGGVAAKSRRLIESVDACEKALDPNNPGSLHRQMAHLQLELDDLIERGPKPASDT